MSPGVFQISTEMKERYLQRRLVDLTKCREALKNEDWTTLETVGHQLRGNAASFGYPELGTIASEMEQHARARAIDGVEEFILRLEQWLQKNPLNTNVALR